MKVSSLLKPVIQAKSLKRREEIIHECIRVITNIIPIKQKRIEITEDKNLPKYLLLSMPYLSKKIIKMIFEVLIEQASKEFILLKNLYESLEEFSTTTSLTSNEKNLTPNQRTTKPSNRNIIILAQGLNYFEEASLYPDNVLKAMDHIKLKTLDYINQVMEICVEIGEKINPSGAIKSAYLYSIDKKVHVKALEIRDLIQKNRMYKGFTIEYINYYVKLRTVDEKLLDEKSEESNDTESNDVVPELRSDLDQKDRSIDRNLLKIRNHIQKPNNFNRFERTIRKSMRVTEKKFLSESQLVSLIEKTFLGERQITELSVFTICSDASIRLLFKMILKPYSFPLGKTGGMKINKKSIQANFGDAYNYRAFMLFCSVIDYKYYTLLTNHNRKFSFIFVEAYLSIVNDFQEKIKQQKIKNFKKFVGDSTSPQPVKKKKFGLDIGERSTYEEEPNIELLIKLTEFMILKDVSGKVVLTHLFRASSLDFLLSHIGNSWVQDLLLKLLNVNDNFFNLNAYIQSHLYGKLISFGFFENMCISILGNYHKKLKSVEPEMKTINMDIISEGLDGIPSVYVNLYHGCVDPKNPNFEILPEYARFDIDLLDLADHKGSIMSKMKTVKELEQPSSKEFKENVESSNISNSSNRSKSRRNERRRSNVRSISNHPSLMEHIGKPKSRKSGSNKGSKRSITFNRKSSIKSTNRSTNTKNKKSRFHISSKDLNMKNKILKKDTLPNPSNYKIGGKMDTLFNRVRRKMKAVFIDLKLLDGFRNPQEDKVNLNLNSTNQYNVDASRTIKNAFTHKYGNINVEEEYGRMNLVEKLKLRQVKGFLGKLVNKAFSDKGRKEFKMENDMERQDKMLTPFGKILKEVREKRKLKEIKEEEAKEAKDSNINRLKVNAKKRNSKFVSPRLSRRGSIGVSTHILDTIGDNYKFGNKQFFDEDFKKSPLIVNGVKSLANDKKKKGRRGLSEKVKRARKLRRSQGNVIYEKVGPLDRVEIFTNEDFDMRSLHGDKFVDAKVDEYLSPTFKRKTLISLKKMQAESKSQDNDPPAKKTQMNATRTTFVKEKKSNADTSTKLRSTAGGFYKTINENWRRRRRKNPAKSESLKFDDVKLRSKTHTQGFRKRAHFDDRQYEQEGKKRSSSVMKSRVKSMGKGPKKRAYNLRRVRNEGSTQLKIPSMVEQAKLNKNRAEKSKPNFFMRRNKIKRKERLVKNPSKQNPQTMIVKKKIRDRNHRNNPKGERRNSLYIRENFGLFMKIKNEANDLDFDEMDYTNLSFIHKFASPGRRYKMKKAAIKKKNVMFMNNLIDFAKQNNGLFPPIVINNVDIVNKIIMIKFDLSLPKYQNYLYNAVKNLKLRAETRTTQFFNSENKAKLLFIKKLIKENLIGQQIEAWKKRIFDYRPRQFEKFWKFIFADEAIIIDRLFQILILKFHYVNLSQNPSCIACKTLIWILKYKLSPSVLENYKDVKKAIRRNYEAFIFHLFKIADTNFTSKKLKCQGYTIHHVLGLVQKMHLELFFEIVMFDKNLASKIDSYVFQIAFYWTLQSLNDSCLISKFLSFFKLFLDSNDPDKVLASILRFKVFTHLYEVSEAFNLAEHGDVVFDQGNVLWIVKSMLEYIDIFAKKNSSNPAMIKNITMNLKYRKLKRIINEINGIRMNAVATSPTLNPIHI